MIQSENWLITEKEFDILYKQYCLFVGALEEYNSVRENQIGQGHFRSVGGLIKLLKTKEQEIIKEGVDPAKKKVAEESRRLPTKESTNTAMSFYTLLEERIALLETDITRFELEMIQNNRYLFNVRKGMEGLSQVYVSHLKEMYRENPAALMDNPRHFLQLSYGILTLKEAKQPLEERFKEFLTKMAEVEPGCKFSLGWHSYTRESGKDICRKHRTDQLFKKPEVRFSAANPGIVLIDIGDHYVDFVKHATTVERIESENYPIQLPLNVVLGDVLEKDSSVYSRGAQVSVEDKVIFHSQWSDD